MTYCTALPATNANNFMDTATQRQNLTATILSGFCANPAIFAQNSQSGWGLVNASDEDVVGYALSLADKAIEAERITRERKADQITNSRPAICAENHRPD